MSIQKAYTKENAISVDIKIPNCWKKYKFPVIKMQPVRNEERKPMKIVTPRFLIAEVACRGK